MYSCLIQLTGGGRSWNKNDSWLQQANALIRDIINIIFAGFPLKKRSFHQWDWPGWIKAQWMKEK